MNFFIQSLFIAIPIFSILIIIEILIAIKKGLKINNPTDMISSLSSGITNTTKAGLQISFILISYPWLVENFTLFKIEPIGVAIFIAFLIQDFTGYWMHRLNHRVNIFWNRHIIHHSSEEFNLSCALRQSISEMVQFSAFLMIPAAFLGISPLIFKIIGPIHLFMQFWYHTRLISRMGWFEKIIITPSHHRVHHAINPEYIDKNYGQILIIWDKLFGTYQKELINKEPVYGILNPAKTWNPFIINYKHLWQLFLDASRTKKTKDKLRIWFMPTGWRPNDVKEKYPLIFNKNPAEQVKYETRNSKLFIIWSYFQLSIAGGLMLHFFTIISTKMTYPMYFYGLFLMVHIFAYTSALDRKKYSIYAESLKFSILVILLFNEQFFWFGLSQFFGYLLMSYCITSLAITYYYFFNSKNINI
ncbi:sterol desaturase family protein [Candidatus Marinimicrobia bacterium]|nr:sterol desaturase family protein [Candidatus Neomarinimicrobiota bacterium]